MLKWFLTAAVLPAVLLAQPARVYVKVRHWGGRLVEQSHRSEPGSERDAAQRHSRHGAGISRPLDGSAGSGAARR